MFPTFCLLEFRLMCRSYLVLVAEEKMRWLNVLIALKISFQCLISHFPCILLAKVSPMAKPKENNTAHWEALQIMWLSLGENYLSLLVAV